MTADAGTLLTRTRPHYTSRELLFMAWAFHARVLLHGPRSKNADGEYFDDINDLIVDVEEKLEPGDERPAWLDSLYQRWTERPATLTRGDEEQS